MPGVAIPSIDRTVSRFPRCRQFVEAVLPGRNQIAICMGAVAGLPSGSRMELAGISTEMAGPHPATLFPGAEALLHVCDQSVCGRHYSAYRVVPRNGLHPTTMAGRRLRLCHPAIAVSSASRQPNPTRHADCQSGAVALAALVGNAGIPTGIDGYDLNWMQNPPSTGNGTSYT